MANETYLTVRGFVGSDPMIFRSETGRTTAVVRVGVTARNYDRAANAYVDGMTAWYTVRCYGDLGENVAKSVTKGCPVLVRGRLSLRTWNDRDGHSRTEFVIAADSLGLDLNTGWAKFQRSRPRAQAQVTQQPSSRVDSHQPSTSHELGDEGARTENDEPTTRSGTQPMEGRALVAAGPVPGDEVWQPQQHNNAGGVEGVLHQIA
ncbi:single-stranded DNA-binding protein [Arcanobacterium haemolyticum]|nr:single-stranded DNA-binding protein [Arcanobacterium haemolyticum]